MASRREFLRSCGGLGLSMLPMPLAGQPAGAPGFRLVDVTAAAGLQFRHNSGAYGGKLLPETLGAGCAFLDYDADGWQDILLINGMDWPGHRRQRSNLALYRNNRNGTFTDVTRAAGLDVEMYGMGVAAGDFNNDGFTDVLVTCVGQNRLFSTRAKARSSTSPQPVVLADERRSERRRNKVSRPRSRACDSRSRCRTRCRLGRPRES